MLRVRQTLDHAGVGSAVEVFRAVEEEEDLQDLIGEDQL